MSQEQPVSQNVMEQTKQRIRMLVFEITQFAKSDIPPEEFHAELLPRMIQAVSAEAGAIWTKNDGGQLELGYQINIVKTGLPQSEEANREHSRLLYKILRGEEVVGSFLPNSGGEGEDAAGNPTPFPIIFGLIRTELEVIGIIELFQRAETAPSAMTGFVRFMGQMVSQADSFYKDRQLRNFNDRQSLWTQLEDFTRNIHKTLDLKETEYTVANESRRLIQCDRVSLAIKRGSKCRVEAVSGQDIVDKRSNAVVLLGKLATAVVKANEAIYYTGDTTNFAPQVESAIEEYVDESHTKMISVFPLTRKNINEGDSEQTEENKLLPEPPFGAIIIEQIEDSRLPDRMKKRIEIVVDHACTAVGNALDHHNVFLMPLWSAIGKSKVLTTARMLPKTISVTLGILGVIAALIFVPWNFNMHCKGTLEPESRRNIFAREEGKVDQVLVHHGDTVYGPNDPNNPNGPEATLLVRLTNNQLEADYQKVQGDLGEVAKQIAATSEVAFSKERNDERVQGAGELEQLAVRKRSLEIQRDILQERLKELEIRAPISGTVMTFDLDNKLQSRPVQPGQILMEIAEPTGRQILELDMPEKKMGHIDDYMRKIREKDPEAPLKVNFVMTVDSTRTFTGTVIEEHDRAENRGEDGTTVQLKASIDDPDSLPQSKRAGASVAAKVYCGKRALGYVLFNEAVAYLEKTVFFWFK